MDSFSDTCKTAMAKLRHGNGQHHHGGGGAGP
jgi:hypothetical protein